MLSSEKNIERIVHILQESKQYAELQLEYAKLDATGKIAAALSATILFVVLFVIGAIFVVLLSCTAAFLLNQYVTHNSAVSFAIISAMYLVVAILVYLRRKQWIINPVSRMLGRLLFSSDKETSKTEEL